MIKSMTGFGRAELQTENKLFTFEIHSVNSRYLDTSIRLPRNCNFMEDKIKKLVGEYISRAKVDTYLGIDSLTSDTASICLDKDYTRQYMDALYDLRDSFGLTDDITVMNVAKNMNIFTVEKFKEDEDELFELTKQTAVKALEAYNEMRKVEGAKLYDFFISSLQTVETYVDKIEELSPLTVAAYKEKLYARIKEMLGDAEVDEGRLLTECAIFADKVSITEEIVRLRSHIAQYRSILKEDIPVGRKLDFLTQEMNRETNTIGSKANDREIAKLVIEIKAEIEKIREQVQNVE